MSGSCQQATSFDHLVGAGDEGSRKIEAEGFCRLQVNDELELGRLHDKELVGMGSLDDAASENSERRHLGAVAL